MADCDQCSSLLSSWIECLSVAPQDSSSTHFPPTTITAAAASVSTSSQTLVQSSQDTDVTMAPPPLPSPSPHLAQSSQSNNSNFMRASGTQPCSASSSPPSHGPAPVNIPVHVGSEELAQILRSAAANSPVLPHSTPTTTSMSSPPTHQHQQQRQRNRQARLSISRQFASQSTPMAMPMPSTSASSIMTASGLTARMSSIAPSDCGGQSLQVLMISS